MLTCESTEEYKKGWRDALQMIVETAADAPDGRELVKILKAAVDGINEAETLIQLPWH